MTDIKPRIDDDGLPWCDAGCPQAIRLPPPTTLVKCHLDKEERYSNWHCPHAVKRMAVALKAFEDELLRTVVSMPFGCSDVDSLIAGVKRMAVALKAFEDGRMYRCGDEFGVDGHGPFTREAATDALMAEREE